MYFRLLPRIEVALPFPKNNNLPNRFLAQLPKAFRARFVASATPVELRFAELLTQPGDTLTHVYFPSGSFISQIAQVERRAIEVSLVGDEGMYGICAAMDELASPVKAIVQGAGPALKMPVAVFRQHLEKNAELRRQVSRYTYVAYSQVIQSAACNRFHVVEQRLARWLLMTADRAHSPAFHVTQAFLALMLGVRRVGVTKAASELQARGLIRYARGHVQILDMKGLRQASCSCYRSDVARYERFFAQKARGVEAGA